MITYISRLFTKKEQPMAKQAANVVKFTRVDAPKPTKTTVGLISLKAPFPLTLKPQSSARIDMGLTCSHALIVGYAIGDVSKHSFEYSKPIVFTLKNPSFTDDIVIDVGTVVVNVVPLLTPDFDIE